MRKLLLALAISLLALPIQVFAKDDCGTENKRVCYVWEKYPLGCQSNLLAVKGVCKHPACGRDKQYACTPDKRLLPCDWGLVINPDKKCYTAKQTDQMAAAYAAEQTCKAGISMLKQGQLPPMMQPVVDQLGQLARSATANTAKYEKPAKDFIQKNGGNYAEIQRISTMLKNDHNKLAALKRYLTSDDICKQKPFNARVAELRNMGLLPDLKLARAGDDTGNAGFSLISSAMASEPWDPVLTYSWEVALNGVVKGVAKIGILLDFKNLVAGPVVVLGIGGATNLKAAAGAELAFMYEPRPDVAAGMDLAIEVGGGEGVGGGAGVIWNPNLPYPYGGFANIGVEASLIPVDMGVTAEWHWVLLPKNMGGAL